MFSDQWIRKDVKGTWRRLIWGNIPALAWKDWDKPEEIWVRITGLGAEIWNRDFRSTKQECCRLYRDISPPYADETLHWESTSKFVELI
jgi:hypothetical protein